MSATDAVEREEPDVQRLLAASLEEEGRRLRELEERVERLRADQGTRRAPRADGFVDAADAPEPAHAALDGLDRDDLGLGPTNGGGHEPPDAERARRLLAESGAHLRALERKLEDLGRGGRHDEDEDEDERDDPRGERADAEARARLAGGASSGWDAPGGGGDAPAERRADDAAPDERCERETRPMERVREPGTRARGASESGPAPRTERASGASRRPPRPGPLEPERYELGRAFGDGQDPERRVEDLLWRVLERLDYLIARGEQADGSGAAALLRADAGAGLPGDASSAASRGEPSGGRRGVGSEEASPWELHAPGPERVSDRGGPSASASSAASAALRRALSVRGADAASDPDDARRALRAMQARAERAEAAAAAARREQAAREARLERLARSVDELGTPPAARPGDASASATQALLRLLRSGPAGRRAPSGAQPRPEGAPTRQDLRARLLRVGAEHQELMEAHGRLLSRLLQTLEDPS